VPVVYAFLGAVLALTGPGRYALDRALGITTFTDPGWGVAAIAAGVLAAAPMLLRRRAALGRQPLTR
jgi:hypothetical protein